VDVKPMITHRFAFDKDGVADGFDCAARSAQTKAIKVPRSPSLCHLQAQASHPGVLADTGRKEPATRTSHLHGGYAPH
jgi:hypothetical protein